MGVGCLKVLALDIGAGTEDVLLYDDKKTVENCLKMVLPSPSRIYATHVRAATQDNQDLFIDGDIIGGGTFVSALKQHLDAGLRVMMTEHAAYTVRNDLDEVRQMGIQVTAENPPPAFQGRTLTLEEINLTTLKAFLTDLHEPLSDLGFVAVAVQDHGVVPQGMRNRRFRIRTMQELLANDPRPETLLFDHETVPPRYLRMRSAIRASQRQLPTAEVVVMDTAPAAILGCLEDSTIREAATLLAVNVGNDHTMAAVLEGRTIVGVMEHHTHLLTPSKMEKLLVAFADGRLRDEEIFRDRGHGVFFLNEPVGFTAIEQIVVTGPNRHLVTATGLPVHCAAPAGDVMMTGPMGLVAATRRRFLSL